MSLFLIWQGNFVFLIISPGHNWVPAKKRVKESVYISPGYIQYLNKDNTSISIIMIDFPYIFTLLKN